MMTGGKVILTYKRQRRPHLIAYKRKKRPSRKDFSQNIECCKKSVDCPNYNATATSEKLDESNEDNKSEFPINNASTPAEKQEESAEGNNSEYPSCNIPTAAEKQEESTEGNRSGCPAENHEYAPEGKKQFSNYVRQTNCLESTEKASKAENKNVFVHDIRQLAADSRAVLEEIGFPVRDKSSRLCTTATLHSKLSSPPVTFYRRCKRKKDVDGLHSQNTLGVTEDCALAFKGSKSARFASKWELTPPESGSERILVNTNPSEKNLNGRVSFDANREKMASTYVEYSCASRSSPETGNIKQADDKLENISQDNHSIAEVIPRNSVDVDFQEGPISCTGNLTNDSADDPSHEPVSSNGLTTVGKESRSLSNENLNNIRITSEIPSCRSSVVPLDLSVPLPDSHDVEDCGSLCSQSVSHTTIFNNESPGNKGSGLLHKKVGESRSLHQAQVSENGCFSDEAVDHKYDSFASTSSAFKLENNCLQLFPEDRTDDSTKIHQNSTACVDSEDRTVSLFESRSQAHHAATNSSLFLGLFLPMELINDGRDSTSTSSQWPNVGIQSKESTQNTVPRHFPDQSSSYRRHKMVLDDIANRARMPKQKRGACLDLYDSSRMWSEEELDCLWVGIRRYGRGNWEVMLRDPRLHFSPWMTPRDLAEQWEKEQTKLFNTMPSRGRHLRTPNILQDSMDCFWRPKTRRENLGDNVQLSLGNIYSQPNDIDRKRSLFNFFNAQNNAPRQLQKAVTNARPVYSCRGNHRKAMLQNNAMLDVECSLSASQSTCMAMGENLPHWLREVVSIPLRPPQTVLPLDTLSVGGHAEMQWVNKPFLDARGVHHEPINQMSNKHTIVGRGEQQTGTGVHNVNFLSALEHVKTEQGKYPGNKQDLIIIDSDASSEETISDDRSTKV